MSIRTDGGRLCRPLYIVKDNKLLITKEIVNEINEKKLSWQDILIRNIEVPTDCDLCSKVNEVKEKDCIIEYIDTDEADTCMIAMSQDNLLKNNPENDSYLSYTHCEMHPAMMFGALVSNVPFSDHNQAPRNIYQAAMGKQAIGIYNTAYRNRFDTVWFDSSLSTKTICNTIPSKYVHSDEIPCV